MRQLLKMIWSLSFRIRVFLNLSIILVMTILYLNIISFIKNKKFLKEFSIKKLILIIIYYNSIFLIIEVINWLIKVLFNVMILHIIFWIMILLKKIKVNFKILIFSLCNCNNSKINYKKNLLNYHLIKKKIIFNILAAMIINIIK
jgi:hypothetical protein